MGVLGFLIFGPELYVWVVVGLVAVVFWGVQFLRLMAMPDSAFPGKYDKLVWGMALVVLTVVGAFVFREWRYGQMRKQRAREMEELKRRVEVVG